MKDAYTTNEIADAFEVSVKNAIKRARREGWQSRPRAGRGGGHEWLVSSMPEKTRLTLAARVCVSQHQPEPSPLFAVSGLAAPASPRAAERPGAPDAQKGGAGAASSLLSLKGAAKKRAEARAAVVLAARTFTVNVRLAYTRALDAFARRYNAGEISVDPWVRAALPSLSRSSLINWERRAQERGMASLAGNYGQHRKGKGLIDSQPQVRELVLGLIAEYPAISAELIREDIERLRDEQPDIRVPSLRRVQAWLADWKAKNPQLALYMRAPDRWRGQFMAACGSMYELVTQYNQRWEYDGTPADLLLNDGKRYTIVGTINVYSRELLLEVAERSTGVTVANLTRTALLDWGVPDEAVTDNGKEFVGTHMQGLFLDLGIMPTILPPFRPDLKPAIERAFRSFSHHLLTLCPCYVGHNVAARQEIRERETFAKRLMNRKEPQELSMGISPEELQAFCNDWCKSVYAHRPHRSLKGKTPWQMRREYAGEIRRIEDERALDVLLTPLATDGGWRTVGKEGIRAGTARYVHAALGPCMGQRVQVRVNKVDAQHAYVFDEAGRFVCKAVATRGLNPVGRRDVALATRRAQKVSLNAQAKEMRASARAVDAASAGERIMEMHKRHAAAIEAQASPAAHTEAMHTSPMLDSAARAARLMAGVPPHKHGTEVAAARALAQASQKSQAEKWLPDTPQAQYKLYRSLVTKLECGESVPPEQREWMEIFSGSNICKGFAMLEPLRQAVNE